MNDEENWRRFELLAMPHLDAAYNLARWLTRDDHDAQDIVQDAVMRATRYIDGLRAEGARGWLLQIVRNTYYSWLKTNRPAERVVFDDFEESSQAFPAPAADEPQAVALRKADRAQLDAAIAALPVAYREVLVLRELEDLSYGDIARIVEIPIGTVMSRLSRARGLLRAALAPQHRPLLHAVPAAAKGRA
ncbi:MAG TPA: sigma-70 family RNA polymerase sigma factor [Burkholderiaceae bacterium]